MSSKSTILSLPCCHIYDDCIGANGGNTFAIGVSYGNVAEGRDDNNFIEVEANSEFANLMRYLLAGKTEEELLAASEGRGVLPSAAGHKSVIEVYLPVDGSSQILDQIKSLIEGDNAIQIK